MEKYCARSEVMAELGKDFLPAAPKEAGGAAKKRRDSSI
jgi:hypothetical protein